MAFKKIRYGEWKHVATGVIIRKADNPTATRKYYVQWSGDEHVCSKAFALGCGGGFFWLATAKAAIERAHATA